MTRYKDILETDFDHATHSSIRSSAASRSPTADGLERPSFIRMDPPNHAERRRTVAPIVAPNNIANMENLIHERTSHTLDSRAARRTLRLGERVSIELTTLMLATLFDFP